MQFIRNEYLNKNYLCYHNFGDEQNTIILQVIRHFENMKEIMIGFCILSTLIFKKHKTIKSYLKLIFQKYFEFFFYIFILMYFILLGVIINF